MSENGAKIEAKQVEIFSGTGGVGKTTLATSRAIHLAELGKKVLLITIDPAKRLKEIMGIADDQAGEIITVKNPFGLELALDVELMSAHQTIKRIASQSESEEVLNSRILKILTKPYGGLNEILALVELQLNLQKNTYDIIVLDTPPGSHFLDFLEGIDKIRDFFDQNFIDIFNYLDDKKRSRLKTGRKLMTMMISSGVKKLLDYLGKVTGAKFVEDFMRAIGAIYSTQASFMQALELQKELKDPTRANWFLTTSVDQSKILEALKLKDSANNYITTQSILAINKTLATELKSGLKSELSSGDQTWQDDENSVESKLINNLIWKEETLVEKLAGEFKSIIRFKEIISISPEEHVTQLKEAWKNY